NPAGLSQIRKHEISAIYLKGLTDTWYGSIGYAHPLKSGGKLTAKGRRRTRTPVVTHGTLAIGIVTLQAGKMMLDPEGKTVVAEQDYLVTLGYGYPIWRSKVQKPRRYRGLRFEPQAPNEISVGINVKILHSTLVESYSAMAYAGDVGALCRLRVGGNSLRIGLAAQNLGTKLKFEEEGDPLPLTIRFGGAYRMNFGGEHSLTSVVEAVKPNDNDFRVNVGVEYWYKNIFALRSGYKIGYDLDSFTAGTGFNWKGYGMDYGWGMMESKMGSNHRVSFTARF
ncbi:MAG: PorV/PorQ family protein, partial [bacterium]